MRNRLLLVAMLPSILTRVDMKEESIVHGFVSALILSSILFGVDIMC